MRQRNLRLPGLLLLPLAAAVMLHAGTAPTITGITVNEQQVTIHWDPPTNAAMVESFRLGAESESYRIFRAATRGTNSSGLSFETGDAPHAFFRVVTGQDVPPEILDNSLLAALARSIDAPLKQQPTNAFFYSDIPNLTNLHARGAGITSLAGLDILPNLAGLDLSRNPDIADFSIITNWPHLPMLGLADNDLGDDDLHFLVHMTELRRLELYGNRLNRGIKELEGLTHLVYLNIRGNHADTLDPLGALTRLEDLRLGNPEISNLAPLNACTNLTRLGLYDMPGISHLNDLPALEKLQRLDIQNMTNLVDISVVTNFHVLSYFEVSHAGLRNIAPLASATNLSTIILEYTHITDIQPLLDNADAGGLGSRAHDYVSLKNTPLSDEARTNQVPALRDQGVTVDLY